jgi:sucrose phosphorylase
MPFTNVRLDTGEERVLWTTFTPQQVDIDVLHTQGTAYLSRILSKFSQNGIRMARLDAVGYAVKKPGTSCFMIPETFDFIADITARARAQHMEVLVEIHSYHRKQIEIAAHVDWVYDFALPPLVLHAFEFGTGKFLAEWARIRPCNALTVLDTHDGIGMVDIGPDHADPTGKPGLVPVEALDALVERIHRNSGERSRLATGEAASNIDLYQINCTFYDAMARDDLRYLLARAIQFFFPGIPQVYYVGLLAGTNDMNLLARSGVGRDINRRHYSMGEIEQAMRQRVTQELFKLIRLRNSHPAFGGKFRILPSADECLHMRWDNDAHYADLRVDFSTSDYELRFSDPDGRAAQVRFQVR